jgi:hypothetical protein
MTTQRERRLPSLPEYGAELSAWRDWLCAGLSPADGFRVDDFLRHGRNRDDGCELVVIAPGGRRLRFEIEEQRQLMSPASLRATVVAATDGLLRPDSLSRAELEDVWIALCTLATVTANQSEKAVARDWIGQLERAAERIEGYTLKPPHRLAGLVALDRRRTFDNAAAGEYLSPDVPPADKPRPGLLVDCEEPDVRWMRVGEAAVFLRRVVGIPTTNQSKIDSRLAAVGVGREFYATRGRATHTQAKANLYRLPPTSEEDFEVEDEPGERP